MSDPLPPELQFGIQLTPIVERLKTLSYFLSVEDVAALALAFVGGRGAQAPAAFVSTSRLAPEGNQLIDSGEIRQRVNASISVMFCERTGRADGELNDRLDATWRAVTGLLVGWTAPGALRLFEFGGYSLRSIEQGYVWGEVVLNAPFTLRLARAV